MNPLLVYALFGKEAFDGYLEFRTITTLLFLALGVIASMIGGAVYIAYRVYEEIALEWSFRQQYAADWQVQFEHYHGPLAHAHTRLAIGIASLLALAVIFGWGIRRVCRNLKQHREGYPV